MAVGQGEIVERLLADLDLLAGHLGLDVVEVDHRLEHLLGLIPLVQVVVAPPLLVEGVGVDLGFLVLGHLLVGH